MSTTAIDLFIREAVMQEIGDNIWEVAHEYDFEESYDEAVEYLFNGTFNAWTADDKPSFDDFLAIQEVCFEHLDGYDSLNHEMIGKKDWTWWCNIYALSSQWRNCSMDDRSSCDKCHKKLEEGEVYCKNGQDLCFDCKYVEVQQ